MPERDDHEIRLSAPRRLLCGLNSGSDSDLTEFDLLRVDDQLNLRFTLHGGTIDRVTNEIIALLGEEPIYFAISLGPQHHVEDSIAAGNDAPTKTLASRIAGDTRIVVEIPDRTLFTVANLLDLGAYALHVAQTAGVEPDATQTAIEIPAGLVLSPAVGSRFEAPTTPNTHGEVTERWRARLEPARRFGPSRLVALYSHPGDPTFDVPVDHKRRLELIDQTQVDPFDVRRLDVSPQGAEFDVGGAWAAGQPASYQHRVVTGRDLRIEIVDRGFLAPFGHRAVVTTLTERDLVDDSDGDLTGVLTTEEHFDIVEPLVDGPHPYVAFEGRALPFTRIAAADPGAGAVDEEQLVLDSGGTISTRRAFAVWRDGEPLTIAYTATDHDGNDAITFDLPAVFVADQVAFEPRDRNGRRVTALGRLTTWYEENPAEAELGGQGIAWAAAPADLSRGDAGSVQSTTRICFQLDRPALDLFDPADVEANLPALGRPAFAARVHDATVLDQSGAAVAGAEPPSLDVVIADRYLEHGLDELNVDLGYLDIDVPGVTAPSTQGDGLLSIGLNVDTFSQLLGGGVEIGTSGVWDPLEALGDLSNKLLGLIDLTDLIPTINVGSGKANLPTIEVELVGDEDPLSIPTGVCTTLLWEPEVTSVPKDSDNPTFVVASDFEKVGFDDPVGLFGNGTTNARLEIETCVPGGVVIDISLERFGVQLPPGSPVIAALFERIRFVDDHGVRSVDTSIAEWVFVGSLSWLEPVKDLLFGLFDVGSPSFEDGFALDFDIPVPSIALGVIGVTNIDVALALNAPASAPARLEFGLSTRDDPFRVTLMAFGGTGHFIVVVDAGDIVLIEGSIGITYEMSVNVFIVSAAISITLSAYVRYEKIGGIGEVEFGATVEVAGAISILGLVKISGSVMVGLVYRPAGKVLRGVAAVTGEISTPFGTDTVTRDVEVEVTFADSGGARDSLRLLADTSDTSGTSDNPSLTFGDLYDDLQQWSEYCAAFVTA